MTVSELAVPMAIESRAHDLVRTDRGPVVAPSHVPSARIHGYQYTTHQPSGYKTTVIASLTGKKGEERPGQGRIAFKAGPEPAVPDVVRNPLHPRRRNGFVLTRGAASSTLQSAGISTTPVATRYRRGRSR